MIPLAEHDAAGAIRYFLATETPPPAAHRPIATLAEAIPEIGARGGFFSGAFACLDCAAAWAAVGPVSADLSKLECFRCGAHRSAPVLDGWCSACGAESRVAQEPGCPAEGGECHVCHAMAVMVEAA